MNTAELEEVGAVVDRLLNRLLWVVATLGLFAVAGSLNRWYQQGWHIQHLQHLGVYLVVVLGFLAGTRIPRWARVAIILGALGINGVGNLVWHGLAGTGLLFMAVVCILTAVFATVRAAWVVLSVFSVIVVVVGVGIWRGCIPILDQPAMHLRSGVDWVAQGMVFLALVVAAIASVNAIQQALRRSSSRLAKRTEELEQEIEEHHRVALKRAALEEQLHQSDRLQALGQLAGGIAHDFNNQLAGVIGFAEMLKRKSGSDTTTREYADKILSPAHRAADLTAKLLAFARKGHYRSEAVDLHGIISEVVSILQRSIDKTIVIEERLHASCALVSGDPTLIQSAVLNVALNARDALPTGGTITFSTDNDAPEGEGGAGVLLLRIRDTGIGMDEATAAKVFEPFFTTKPSGKGTGMGLAAVYGTMQSHGGTVEVESAENNGTVFTLSFPLMRGNAGIETSSPSPDVVHGTGHVLVIDDERSVLEMTADMLEGLGYRVTTRDSVSGALALYRDSWREFDVVLLDMVLPEMNGRRVFEALRAVNPDARIVLFSGYSSNRDAHALLELGAAGFLQKPFSISDISRQLASALGRGRA